MKNRKTDIVRFVVLLGIILIVNIGTHIFRKHWDLTAEKRFSLSEATVNYLHSIKEPTRVRILLAGKLPAGFQRLQERCQDVLSEFRSKSGGDVLFTIENPIEGKAPEERKPIYEALAKKGVQPMRLEVRVDESNSQSVIFPYAIVAHNGKEFPVNLLENHQGMSPLQSLDYSASLLEYKFAQAIMQTEQADKIQIAYAQGQQEALGWATFDILSTIDDKYHLDTIDLNQNIEVPLNYKCLIIAGPHNVYDEKVKFKIDQFIMNGGRVFWLLNALSTGMDSLSSSGAYLAIPQNLNLDDMLFKYGVRLNTDIIEDFAQNTEIPVTIGETGGKPDIRFAPWVYFPNAIPTSKHPIVRNMDAVMFQFANSLDTIKNENIRKTILLASSPKSRRQQAPTRIDLSSLQYAPRAELFNEKNIPMAVLLEGKFSSVFKNRLDPKFVATYQDSLKKTLKDSCDTDNRMIVVSNADIFYNAVSNKMGPLECGMYQYTNRLYANKIFIMNCIEYLTDNNNIIEARNKDLVTRLLNMDKIEKEKSQWQILNIGLPIMLTILFASAFLFFRKKKYTGN